MKPTWTAGLGIAAVRFLSTPVLAQIDSVVASVTSEVSPAVTTDSSTQTASGSIASSTPTSSSEPKVHLIKAGAGGFKFTPQEIHNVSVGDIVSWEFYPPDHSVARAEYNSACVPYEYTGKDKVGFWSETQWVKDTSQITYFNITINSTEPIFFYCAAPKSCTDKHMVGAINPNSTQTLASQVHAAAVADFQVAPGETIPAEASSTLSSAPTSTGAPAESGGDDGNHSLSTGAIAGIVVGGVAFLAICAALFFFVGRSKTLKETIKRQDAANNPEPHMSQQYGGGSSYGQGGLASPGFQASTPGYATPPPGHHADYGYGSPPLGEQHPNGWTSPTTQQGHLSMMSSVSGMSQQQIEQLKHAHMHAQPHVAELHSPPLEQQSFSAELEAPGRNKGEK